VFIADTIANGRFRIAGGRAGLDVSWQVTGVRKDPYAEAHRIPVEENKPDAERGTYLHPDAWGKPEELSVERVLLPQQPALSPRPETAPSN
jgi:hypothetical protein